jgi:cell division protease FtsH
MENKPPRKRILQLLAAGLLTGILASVAINQALAPEPPEKVTLSEALAEINDGKVAEATVLDGTNELLLTRTEEAGGGELTASYPYAYAKDLTQVLLDAQVKTSTEPPQKQPIWVNLLLSLVPLLIILGVLAFLMTRGGSLMTGGIGKLSGKKGEAIGQVPDTRFSDVAGADEAKAELMELVQFLRDPDRFTHVGAKAPRGALLVGPPGTGKTLLARAVAGEARVPFFALAGSDFVETFVGVGAKRVRDVFDNARKSGQAIVFIDEIDAIGKKRGTVGPQSGGDAERENTLISMLNEMDGFSGSSVIVLAATNRADVLDEALTRPGRLDRQIQVPSPDRRGRTEILQVHAKGRPLAGDVDFVAIARQTPGMSGAELAQVVNEACMEAARRDLKEVDASCFQSAIATVALGRARTSALVTDIDRKITAWHEAGHTVAAFLQPHADDPVEVTIIPRGPSGGATWMAGNDNMFMTRSKALADLVTSMAGRAAEEMLLGGDYTQGAVGDLASATDLARRMVTQYGMSTFGLAQVDADTLRMGGQVSELAHRVIDRLLQDALEEARKLLARHQDFLTVLADTLLVEETIGLARVRELYHELSLEQVKTA